MFYFLQFSFLLFSALFVDAQRSPTISYISQEKVVNIGDTVELDCTVQYTKDYPVVWLKTSPHDPSEYVFISSGTLQIVPGDRYTVSYSEATGTYTLKVTKLQEIDAGLYECQIITGPGNKLKANVWVHIRLPPVISDNSTRSVITSTGSTVDLNCYASGYPEPRISWRRENNELLPTGGTMYIGKKFTIFNVTKDDRGTYYCIADNGVGKGARRNIGLEVEYSEEQILHSCSTPSTSTALRPSASAEVILENINPQSTAEDSQEHLGINDSIEELTSNTLTPGPSKVSKPAKPSLRDTLFFRKKSKKPAAPSAGARAAACVEREHQDNLKFMARDDERKETIAQLQVELLKEKIAYVRAKKVLQEIMIDQVKRKECDVETLKLVSNDDD